MRKFTMIIFMSLLLGVGFSGIAYAGPGNGKFCKDATPADFGLDHDTCVVCVAQGAADVPPVISPVCACKILQDQGVLDVLGLSLGDCVSQI